MKGTSKSFLLQREKNPIRTKMLMNTIIEIK